MTARGRKLCAREEETQPTMGRWFYVRSTLAVAHFLQVISDE
jgi:hypothetical protein